MNATMPAALGWRTAFTPGEMRAYALVLALGFLPRMVLLALPEQYQFEAGAKGSPPFVIFSVTILFMICMIRPLMLVFRRHDAPLRQIGEDVTTHWPWLVTIGLLAVAMPEALEAATRIKKLIPQFQPFYLDAALIEWEHWLLGRDAWEITHAFIGTRATLVLDTIYGLWHLVNISLLCWIVLSRDRAFQLQAALSYQLAWLLLGGVAATALASVGPCFLLEFTGDPRFVPLMEQLRQVNGPEGLHSLIAMKYLLAEQGMDGLGNGISAMPSLHVAIAGLTVMMMHRAFPGKRWPMLLASFYALIIFVTSVHLGWHYALDGVVGVAGTVLIWFVVKALLRRLLTA